MLRLDFTYADLRLPDVSATTCHASVSGVQEKVQVRRVRGGYEVAASLLSDEAKNRYLALFHDRLKAVLNGLSEQSTHS